MSVLRSLPLFAALRLKLYWSTAGFAEGCKILCLGPSVVFLADSNVSPSLFAALRLKLYWTTAGFAEGCKILCLGPSVVSF